MSQHPESASAVHLLLRYLEQEGVSHIFGIPGGPIISLYEALYVRKKITPVLTKHEAGAAFMADGYARVSGRIGVCCTTTGPGATNALTGIAVAHADHIPVLLLTAQVPTHQFGKGAFQESGPEGVDLVSLFRPVTKWSSMIPHPQATAAAARKALRLLTSGRPGPVHLNLPCNFSTQPVFEEPTARALYRSDAQVFDRSAVREAAHRLTRARRPAILAGHGVNLARAWHPLRRLAERYRMPVATTFKAKGAFPEDHELSLGVFGYGGDPRALETIAGPEADAVLVVGTSLGEVSSCGWDARLAGKTLLQIDVDPAEVGKNFPVEVPLIGNAGAVLTELGFALERARCLRQERQSRIPVPAPPGPEEPPAGGPLKPRQVLRVLREALPDDAIVFVDNGTIRAWAGRYFPVRRENSFFVNMGMASMGYAVAGCIGGKLADPGRPVVCLTGDAAFAMNGMEVHTALEHKVPVVWIVVNNGGHGMIYHGERLLYRGRFRSSIFENRLAVGRIAEALGAASFSARSAEELARALERALALSSPCVIDVDVDLHEVPPMGARVEAVQRELVTA